MAACVRSRLNSASSEVSLGRFTGTFSPALRSSSSRTEDSRRSALLQNFRAKRFLFAQYSQQQMFGAHVFVAQPLGFFRREIQYAFALLAQRHFHRGGDALAHGDARFDFLADGFDRAVRAQESVGQRFVFAHQAQQQMLGLDVGAAVLAGLITREEDYPTRFFSVAFKHGSSALPGSGPLDLPQALRKCALRLFSRLDPSCHVLKPAGDPRAEPKRGYV